MRYVRLDIGTAHDQMKVSTGGKLKVKGHVRPKEAFNSTSAYVVPPDGHIIQGDKSEGATETQWTFDFSGLDPDKAYIFVVQATLGDGTDKNVRFVPKQ